LLIEYARRKLGRPAVALAIEELDAPFIIDFLQYLEKDRANCARSRNARLAAIRSFMRYASTREPTAIPTAQRVLAIPMKRFDKPLIGFLSREEVQALIAAPDRTTWSGRRDHALIMTAYNTGARVSELAALTRKDLSLDHGSSVLLYGKGRKHRTVPLWKSTAVALRRWLAEIKADPQTPVFPNRRGERLSRAGIESRLQSAVRAAGQACPSIAKRRVFPHVLRHTIAMHLLQSGVDITVIALWLGHASPATTHQYVEADLAMKERALSRVQAIPAPKRRYRPADELLAFLEGL
jgi:site-specific recombinase XerD